ncbi:DUF3748 domain-containing protein [Algoriphagus sp. H41]|uniref:DUF3748 domain-containing protein n=1 Tax=Algoriphagus oliviformis TaxID=2811231 RepID=A0ABS3C8F0_9BACT|nr:DUF3748 domain-containing protein [Algoriphagus oliviformis]MBN7812440.1 DUF3748 domain-containing protein [Algoriphagus oliviformis]
MTLTPNPNAEERQVTQGNQGHFLNHRQAFLPDDQWVAFDGRGEDPKMGENDLIGMVNLESGEVRELYRVPGQQSFGPGSGAVSVNPQGGEVAFIRGLLSASPELPYDLTRRSCMGLDLSKPGQAGIQNLDARDITPPYTPGALRGGSHAYCYSADGQWLSFTYNDAVLLETSKADPTVKDLRTVAFLVKGKRVEVETKLPGQEFSGAAFTVIAAKVVPSPKPGSDEIQKAAEETWVGEQGFARANGEKVYRAMAYLGDVVTAEGNVVTEVFVTEIPENWEESLADTDLLGSATQMPEVPKAFTQRRVTFLADKKYPGVEGPRHWLRTTRSGDKIFFYAKSDDGVVQLHSVSPNGGAPVQITHNDFSPETGFSLSPDERWVVFGYQNRVYITDLETGESFRVGPEPKANESQMWNFNWSYSGNTLVYNKRVEEDGASFFQIFTMNPFQ